MDRWRSGRKRSVGEVGGGGQGKCIAAESPLTELNARPSSPVYFRHVKNVFPRRSTIS